MAVIQSYSEQNTVHRLDSKLLATLAWHMCMGTYIIFLLGWAQIECMYGASCSAQTAHKPVKQSRQKAIRAYCSDIYCRIERDFAVSSFKYVWSIDNQQVQD